MATDDEVPRSMILGSVTQRDTTRCDMLAVYEQMAKARHGPAH